MTANDKAWSILFSRYDITKAIKELNYFDITAAQIKEVREPRLMCKMDFKQSVAKPFRDHGLSILAIQNGLYRIAKTSPFFEIDTTLIHKIEVLDFTLPDFIETLDFENITSESQALDAAVASGMLNKLLGEESYLTVRGRKYSSEMNIGIKKTDSEEIQDYPISSVQIEVDGGYEGETVLALIEAKMGTADNMNMRQLVYPHVHFENTVSKPVKTFVMFYETGSIFTFIPMLYENGIPSLVYTSATKYRLVAKNKPKKSAELLTLKPPRIDYGSPFPQADDFSKVLFGLLKLSEIQPATKAELFGNFPLHPRQYDYYYNAMRWLGIATRDEETGDCILTDAGETLVSLNENKRLECLYKAMMSDEIFSLISEDPDSTPPTELLTQRKMSQDTFLNRRIKTVLAWLRYFDQSNFDFKI